MSISDFNWKTQRALGKIGISKAPKINQKSGINSTEIFTSEKRKAKTPFDNRGHFSQLLMQKEKINKNKFTFKTQIRPQLKDRTATAHNVSRLGVVWVWFPKSITQLRRYKTTEMINFPKMPKLRLVAVSARPKVNNVTVDPNKWKEGRQNANSSTHLVYWFIHFSHSVHKSTDSPTFQTFSFLHVSLNPSCFQSLKQIHISLKKRKVWIVQLFILPSTFS